MLVNWYPESPQVIPRSHRYETQLNNITATCSRWRQIALNYPLLWTFINYPSFSVTRSDDLKYERLKAYFIRSQSSSISIHAEFCDSYDDKSYNIPTNVLEIFEAHSHRIREYEISVADCAMHQLLPLNGSFLTLKTLRVVVLPRFAPTIPPTPLTVLFVQATPNFA